MACQQSKFEGHTRTSGLFFAIRDVVTSRASSKPAELRVVECEELTRTNSEEPEGVGFGSNGTCKAASQQSAGR
jgi:hypothetical protein